MSIFDSIARVEPDYADCPLDNQDIHIGDLLVPATEVYFEFHSYITLHFRVSYPVYKRVKQRLNRDGGQVKFLSIGKRLPFDYSSWQSYGDYISTDPNDEGSCMIALSNYLWNDKRSYNEIIPELLGYVKP